MAFKQDIKKKRTQAARTVNSGAVSAYGRSTGTGRSQRETTRSAPLKTYSGTNNAAALKSYAGTKAPAAGLKTYSSAREKERRIRKK